MKNKKYLSFYYGWMKTGRMPSPGLCCSLSWSDDLLLFKPADKGYMEYWTGRYPREFNATRQNIVLFSSGNE